MTIAMSDSVLDDLKAQVAAGRVVVVLGSGATIAATQNAPAASWNGLLRLGVRRCVELEPALAGDWEQRTFADVASGRLDDLLAGASKIARALRRQGEWSRWLSDTIGTLETVAPEVFDSIGMLNAPILTTNYDDLIDRRLNRLPITPRHRTEQISFARLESRDTVLHLHGHWRDPETVVLDVGDYERIVGDPLAQAGLRTIGEAWSFVFVGCGEGLSDPNFEQFLDWMGEVLKGSRHRHFRLERTSEVSRRQAWHDERQHRIRVLSFGDDHRDLAAFLAGLRSPVPHPGSTIGTTETIAPIPRSARPVLPAGEYVRLQEKGRTAVQSLIGLANQLRFKSIAAHAAAIHETLEEDLYRVAIAGRSRAGKSTLINALVARSICPVDRVITTAIPIIIGPGEVETATITFEGGVRPPLQLDGPVTSDMLAPYADQRHNPDNAKQVDRIEVRLGHGVLDLGVEYVDIPGFDDPSGKIWSSTREVIEAAHALVLVLDVSTFESGGFALDKATRELLESARQRASPVLIVCNKADKLSPSDRGAAARYVNEQLDRFGIRSVLPRPAFFLSAREAVEAIALGKSAPAATMAFEEALWEQLWNTESVGLRRLHRVFDALRVADEEVATLMRARVARGPEREALRDAIHACRVDLDRIRSKAAGATAELRLAAGESVETARAGYLLIASQYVDSISAEIPLVSTTVEALRDRLVGQCRSVLKEHQGAVGRRHQAIESSVSRSLSRLREKAGLGNQSTEAREVLDNLSRMIGGVPVPCADDAGRVLKLAGAGFSTVAAVGFALGGPLGWIVGGVAGILVSALVDHAADTVDTREKLQARVTQHGNESFAAFGRALDDVIANVGAELDRRVVGRMMPFLSDIEERLNAIREPTSEETRLQGEMRQITGSALEMLVARFGGGAR